MYTVHTCSTQFFTNIQTHVFITININILSIISNEDKCYNITSNKLKKESVILIYTYIVYTDINSGEGKLCLIITLKKKLPIFTALKKTTADYSATFTWGSNTTADC
jgi:hypothetical protein